MKRVMIIALVGVMAFSAVAFAGWKFGAEQGVDVGAGMFPFTSYVGYDFEALYIDTGPLSIFGDFVITREYNWADSLLSGVLAVESELAFRYLSDVDIAFSMDAGIDYAALPESIDLLNWCGGVEVVGYVTDILTINGGVNFAYVPNLPGPGIVPGFETSFHVGFDAEW